jgi:hypothetical protein
MSRKQDDIREDIDKAREGIASKVAELSDRAAAAANKLRLSHQVDERPFTMLAVSLVAGFAAERLLFGRRRSEPAVYVVHDNGGGAVKKRPRSRRDEIDDDEAPRHRRAKEDHVDGHESGFEPMKAVAMVGQMAASALAREVAARLIERPPDFARQRGASIRGEEGERPGR